MDGLLNVSNMKNAYPDALSAIQSALAFAHASEEVEAVKWILSLPQRLRSTKNLETLTKRFVARFVENPPGIVFKPGGHDYFNHTRRYIRISKPQLVRVLHEIGHAKYGESEESAVAYSLGLILKAKPDFVPVLTGHVLENDPY